MDKVKVYRLSDQSDREVIEFDMNTILESGEWEIKEISWGEDFRAHPNGTVFVVFHKVEKDQKSCLLND